MFTLKRPKLNHQLPATPCTEQMRASIVEISKSQNVSIAQVQRKAYEFFLENFDSNTSIIDDNVRNIDSERVS